MTGIEPITSILIGGLVSETIDKQNLKQTSILIDGLAYKSVDKQKLKQLIVLNILFENN